MVFRCPYGTDPINRSPRGQRPLSRTMLVLLAVSSINTSRAGFSMSCAFLQRRRARATSRRCCSAACRAFFKGEIVSLEEPPNRSAAAGDSSLAHRGHDLVQRQIRLLDDQRQQPFRVLLQWRPAPSARLRFDASSIVPAPPPSHRRTRAQAVVLGRFPPGCSGFHGFDHAFTQVLRIWLRHRSGPPKPNQCPQTRSLIDAWESPRFKPAEICSSSHVILFEGDQGDRFSPMILFPLLVLFSERVISRSRHAPLEQIPIILKHSRHGGKNVSTH